MQCRPVNVFMGEVNKLIFSLTLFLIEIVSWVFLYPPDGEAASLSLRENVICESVALARPMMIILEFCACFSGVGCKLANGTEANVPQTEPQQ